MNAQPTLNLMTALGDVRVETNDPRLDLVPESLGAKHYPIPHRMLIDTLGASLNDRGYEVKQMAHALSGPNHQRYFGMAQVTRNNGYSDFSTVIGFRAAHDQKYAVGVVGGSGVFVCSNLCFSAEYKVLRRHTRHMQDDLPEMIGGLIDQIGAGEQQQADDFNTMKKATLKESWANSLMTKLVREGALAPSMLGKVIEEYDTPSHDEFLEDGHSVWTLLNACTEAYKPSSPNGNSVGVLADRSPKAYAVLNKAAKQIVAAA